MRGDALARGARSATFQPAKVTQEKWDAIWAEDKPAAEPTPTSETPKVATDVEQPSE